MEKLDFTCQGLEKCACGNRKLDFACKQRKQTRETEKKEICVSVKKNADTQNKKKGNLRVGEKEGGHAKKEKMRNCVSGKRGADT